MLEIVSDLDKLRQRSIREEIVMIIEKGVLPLDEFPLARRSKKDYRI